MPALFRLPKPVAVSGSNSYPGSKLYFYTTGTNTPEDVYTDADLQVAHSVPVTADADGVFAPIWLDPEVTYKVTWNTASNALIYTVDPISETQTASDIGRILYPRTAAEITAGVTPTNYEYPPGNILRYGAVADSTTDNRVAFLAAVNSTPTGGTVVVPVGTGSYLIDTSGGESTAIEIDRQMTIDLEGVVEASYGAIQANPPTIFLVSGDNVTIRGPGRIVGDGSTNSVNTGTDATFPSLVKVTGDYFTMQDVVIDTPYKVGVFLYSCVGAAIESCRFTGGPTTYTDTAYFGIRCYQGSKHSITKNQFYPDAGGGMYVQCVFSNASSFMNIEGNIAFKPYEKLAYINGDYNTIANNTIVGNSSTVPGTDLYGTVGPPIRHDGVFGVITGNLIYYGGGGISSIGGGGLTIANNTMRYVGQSGVAVFGGSGTYDYLSIRNNVMVNGALPGIIITNGINVDAPSGSNFYIDISHNQVVGFAPADTIANIAAWTSATVIPYIATRKPTTPNGRVYTTTGGGTTGGSEPTWPTTPGNTVVDNTVTWTCVAIDNTTSAGIKFDAPGGGQLNERCIISYNNIAGGAQDCRIGIWTDYMEQSQVSHNRVRCSVYGIQEEHGQYNRYLDNSLDSGVGAAVAIQGLNSASYGSGNTYNNTEPLAKSVTLTGSVATLNVSGLTAAPNALAFITPVNDAAVDFTVAHGIRASISSPNVVLTSGDGTNFGGTEVVAVQIIQ